MKRIRVGVVGVGHLGKLHAQKYAQIPDAELVGVTDVDFVRAKEVASSNSTTAFASYRELIGKVDAISIVTPTIAHATVAMEFLSKGVNVLVEKPITATVAEAEALVRLASENKAILQVGHIERFNPAAVTALPRVTSPLFMECRRLTPFPNRATDVDVVLDLMIHDIDTVLTIAASDVESVSAFGMPLLTDKTDYAEARIRFRNGCAAHLAASRVSIDKERSLKVFYKGGYLTADYLNHKVHIVKASDSKELIEEKLDVIKTDALLEELSSFISCCRGMSTVRVTGLDGLKALKAAELIREAIAAR